MINIGAGPDQLALRQNVRDVLAAECPPDFARQAFADPEHWRGLWKSVVDLGWTAIAGDEFCAIDLVMVLEECGAAIAPMPFLSSVGLAAGVLKAAGLDKTLSEIADGAVATLAAQPAGHRLPGVPMTFADHRVRGRAVSVPDLSRAEIIVMLAASADQTLAAVVKPGAGVGITEKESIDPSRPIAELTVDAVPDATAPVDAEAALAVPLLAAAAELVGVADTALHRAVEHAKSRVQFGKPIGAFQGVKHALADTYVAVQRARSLTYAAAARIDDPTATSSQRWTSAALAKAAAAEAAMKSTRIAVQTHGAIAQTWEHDMHLYARRAWLGEALLGDSRTLYAAVGRRFFGGAR